MTENTMKINRIPSPTWNWLKMNDATVSVPTVCQKAYDTVTTVPDALEVRTEGAEYASDIAGALGDEWSQKVQSTVNETKVFFAASGVVCSDPVIVSAGFSGDGDCGAKRIVVEAESGSEITVLTDFHSQESAKGRACMQTLIRAGRGAKVNLVQIDRLGSGFELLNDVGAVADENAEISVVHIFLGGKSIHQGCNIDLRGDGATVKKDIGYFLKGDQELDMNYVVLHKGKKTECDIKASGVLEGESSKLFRGTIDFQDGCAGSKGAEIEEVILRDDTVANKTIPVILCAEEDVEGSHGATIGRLDEDLIFYMQTRGFEEEEIYKLISKSRLLSFCSKIPDEEIRNKTMTF